MISVPGISLRAISFFFFFSYRSSVLAPCVLCINVGVAVDQMSSLQQGDACQTTGGRECNPSLANIRDGDSALIRTKFT